ncbi:MAG: hypothetical protein KDK91_23865 [Gammaproteobacteria bacterium]|nr:hypothetical protein [Gammaproteobacteria bacterium]
MTMHSDRQRPMTRTRPGITALVALLLWAASAVSVEAGDGVDLHRLWDDRCFDCHGHAGEFARRSLSVVDGVLHGRHHGADLQRFLANHYLPASEVDAVHAMLLAQAGQQERFKTACSGCHGSAAGFVRDSIEWRDGTVHGRKSGRAVRAFLDGHRGLGPAEAEFFTALLERVAREVYRPPGS